jgi:type I restriction enzyme R subunit
MPITGDNEEGKLELDNFIFPEAKYPVIATTSKLMSTGVDAQTCKLIVLDQRIQSMTEFKQIIGRGTRINEDYNKFFFTIMDFKKATELFADPDFDGDPVVIYTPKPGDSPVPPDEQPAADEGSNPTGETDGEWSLGGDEPGPDDDGAAQARKYYVANVPVFVVAERVQYYDATGKLVTESLKDYTKKTLAKEFASLDDFLAKWSEADKKQAIIAELSKEGVMFEALSEEIGKDLDPFDIICHVAWDKPPLTRRERVDNVKKQDYFAKYGEQARHVLAALLDKYADEGIVPIEETQILTINPFTEFGTPLEIISMFGNVEQYHQAISELEHAIYAA